jgi:hypothetical protein
LDGIFKEWKGKPSPFPSGGDKVEAIIVLTTPFQNKKPKAKPLPTQGSLRQLLRTFVVFCRFGVINSGFLFCSKPLLLTWFGHLVPTLYYTTLSPV